MKMHFVCFAKMRLDLPPMDAAKYGVPPGADVDAVDVTLQARDGAEEWFEGWWTKRSASSRTRNLRRNTRVSRKRRSVIRCN